MALTAFERDILIFEATWRGSPGSTNRVAVIRGRFGLSASKYLAVLDECCTDPEAQRVAPSVVRRRMGSNAAIMEKRESRDAS